MVIRHAKLGSVGVSVIAICAVLAAPAAAQTAPTTDDSQPAAQASDDGNINEILVTARRIEERLQDVPIAVSALTAQDLERQQLDDLSDIAEKTVGFAFENFTGAISQPTIRGQTNLRTTSPVQNVATYLNGVYLQRNYFIDQSLLDLQRIEIIKGPQSALYGRNAFAGVINIVARGADLEEFSARATGTIGTDERYDLRGALNVPVIPGRLALFGSVGHSEFDGTWNNSHPLADAGGTTDGNVGGYDKDAYQVGAAAQLGDAFSVEGMYIRTEREIESVPSITLSTAGLVYSFNSLNASPRALPGSPLQNRLFVGELRPSTNSFPGETRLPGLVIDPRTFGLRGPTDIIIGKARFDPGVGPFSLEYTYGHTEANIEVRGSSARDPLRPTILFGANLGTIFDSSGSGSTFTSDSHEARVNYNFGDMISGFVGATYASTSDTDSNAAESATPNSLAEPDPASLFPVAPGLPIPTALFFRRNTFLQRDEDIWSLFGYLDLRPSERIAVTLEGRYTIEDQQANDRIAPDVVANPRSPLGRGSGFLAPSVPRVSRSTNFFTPRATVAYKFDEDHNIYASVARGYKSGGINGVAASFNRTSIITTPGAVPPTQTFVDPIILGQPIPTARGAPAGSTTAVTFAQLIPGTAGLSQVQQFYEAETNWTYEIGTKNSFMDGLLVLNLAAYYTDWKDIQSNAVRLQPDGSPPTSFAAIVPSLIGNVGDVDVYGVEVEGSYQLAEPLRVNFGASYNRARYKSGTVSQRFGASGNCDGTVCAYITDPRFPYPVLDIGGNQLERTPEFDALLGLTFETEFANGWDFFARADGTYQTKQFADEANLAFVPSRTLANASAGVTIGKISVQVWAKNIFDKKYVTSSLFLIGTGGGGSATYVPILGEQRTVGLTGSVRF